MSDTRNHNLNIELTDIKSLKSVTINNTAKSNLFLSIEFKKIEKIKLLDNLVLLIKFTNGSLYFDLSKEDFQSIIRKIGYNGHLFTKKI